MKVILQEDIKSLGKMGDVANVSDGYARNYLIPKKLAVEANVKNVKSLDHEKRKVEDKAKKIRSEAYGLSEKLSAMALTIRAKAGDEERLFGSITNKDIAEALKAEGLDIDRKRILLDEPIKRLGSYSVGVKVHSEVTAHVNVKVVPENEGEET
jgi:large subunit ribosomal protein L9